MCIERRYVDVCIEWRAALKLVVRISKRLRSLLPTVYFFNIYKKIVPFIMYVLLWG